MRLPVIDELFDRLLSERYFQNLISLAVIIKLRVNEVYCYKTAFRNAWYDHYEFNVMLFGLHESRLSHSKS